MRITRIFIIIFIIFLLIHPRWVFKKHIAPFSIVILDDSPSMKIWKNTPDYKRLISSLHIKHRILKISSFGKNNTCIGDALEYAEGHFPDASFILLLSDGINSGGVDPVYTADKGDIPVFVFPFADYFKDNLIKSIYGETRIYEGDTLHLTIQAEGGDSIVVNGKNKWVKIITAGIAEFSIAPDTGNNLYKIYLYPEDKIPENNQGVFACQVMRKKRIDIVSSLPDLDFKYIRRLFHAQENIVQGFIRRKDGFFNIDSLRMDNVNIQDMDLLVVVNPDEKIEYLIEKALEYGKNVLYCPERLKYAPYLPFLPGASRSQKLFLSDSLPPIEYLRPSGMLPGAKGLSNINGKFLFAEMRYKKGNIIESSFKGLWRLALRQGIDYTKKYFNVISKEKDTKQVIYPYIIKAGENMQITVISKFHNGWIAFRNKKEILRRFMGDTLKAELNAPVKGGKYTFKLFIMDSLKGEYPVYVKDISEEFRLNYPDTLLLQSIAELSGGKPIHSIKEIPKFKGKEKEIYFNAVHNPFILGFIILLFGIDWWLWKRNRIKK